jgi:hypothetical protein
LQESKYVFIFSDLIKDETKKTRASVGKVTGRKKGL